MKNHLPSFKKKGNEPVMTGGGLNCIFLAVTALCFDLSLKKMEEISMFTSMRLKNNKKR